MTMVRNLTEHIYAVSNLDLVRTFPGLRFSGELQLVAYTDEEWEVACVTTSWSEKSTWRMKTYSPGDPVFNAVVTAVYTDDLLSRKILAHIHEDRAE